MAVKPKSVVKPTPVLTKPAPPPPAATKKAVKLVTKPSTARRVSTAKIASPVASKPVAPRPTATKVALKIPALLLEGDDTPGRLPGGPGSRYVLGQTTSDAVGTAAELALPESYGTRRIWLVPRDPQWVYAHWDLDRAQLQEYNQLSRDGHLILRIYEQASPAEPATEVHVHPESRSWFAHVGKGGSRYFAVLGFRDRTGEWNEVSRSGAIGTPPDSLSEATTAEFVTLPPIGALAESTGTADALEAAGVIQVVEVIEAIREYLAGEPALVQAIEAWRTAGAADQPTTIELPPPSEFVHWTPEQQQALAQVISMDEVRQVWAGSPASSVALAEVAEAQRQKSLASAAAVPGGAPGVKGVAGPGAISSPHGVPESSRGFWFNVNAELIIYGATEPNARVVIGDRAIRLRQDGTFSYRFALPDGWYGLPVSATSADAQESREALLRFMRETEFHGAVGAHPQDPNLKTPTPDHTS